MERIIHLVTSHEKIERNRGRMIAYCAMDIGDVCNFDSNMSLYKELYEDADFLEHMTRDNSKGYQTRDHWLDRFEGRNFDATTSISKVFLHLCPMEVAFTSQTSKGRSSLIEEVVATNESSRNPEDVLQSYFEATKLVSFHGSFLLLNYTLKRQTNFPLFTEVMKQKVRVVVRNEINQVDIVLRPMIVFLRNDAKDHFMVCVFSGKTKVGWWILYDGLRLKNLNKFPNSEDHCSRSGRVAAFHTKKTLDTMTEGFHVDSIVFEITSTNVKLEECAKAMKQKYWFQSPIILEENSDNDDDSVTVEEDEIKEVSWEGKRNGAPQPEIGPGYVVETKKSQFVCDSKTRSVLQMVRSIDVDEGGEHRVIGDSQNILWKSLHLEKDDVATSRIRVIVICYKDKDGGLKWRPPEKDEENRWNYIESFKKVLGEINENEIPEWWVKDDNSTEKLVEETASKLRESIERFWS